MNNMLRIRTRGHTNSATIFTGKGYARKIRFDRDRPFEPQPQPKMQENWVELSKVEVFEVHMLEMQEAKF